LALPTHVVASIPDSFDPAPYLTNARAQSVPFIALALAAATEALQDAGLITTNHDETQTVTENDNHHVLSVPERTGVAIGAGVGSLAEVTSSHTTLETRGLRRLTPYFVPRTLINLAAGHVSMKFNLRGPNHSCATACATGAHSVGDAYRFVRFGDADVMVAGGTESTIDPLSIAGFSRVKALSTGFNENPSVASRPFDKRRDGFVMGEGSGVLVLEEYEHAKRRGAKIYAEIRGYGLSGDAHHITAPSETGEGGERSMRMALDDAKLKPADIDYINAHGTSTMADTIELGAVERLLGDAAANVTMSSTKSSTGHLLGAAGAIEAIFSILAIRDQVAPPTINLDNPAVETEIDLAPNAKRERKIDIALSNSFGFGGTNASVIFGKVN
jgi:3-oxoacyl-[acyl-carrier-protein] synthase II